ncbi:MAG TPA: DUF4194 domain-containing protein [Xanthobacteraceae bacterium]|jgi:hypothetical protein|nr:DUF4194 domain-containing protein [Xanthobacteraceae bacterium]
MTDSSALSIVVVSLMKGIADREGDPHLWQSLMGIQARVRDYVACLGLDLILDEAEGFAYLRQRPAEEGAPEVPRLVPRRQLGYQASLMLALLRKKLAEFDATSGEARLILRRDDIVEMMRVFFAETANQVRLSSRIEADINRVVDMGFLRRLRGADDRFEVRRILKAFVDAQWLADFDRRLAAYRSHASSEQAAAE